MNQDFKDLLRVFNEEKVKYLIVGGYALIKHSEPRYTRDLLPKFRTSAISSGRVSGT